jgi:hypothetical protein
MPLIDGVSRRQLQNLAIETLIGANTLAGNRVFEPRDWPTRPELFPMLMVQTPRDRKVSLGRGIRQFNTTITLAVIGRIQAVNQEAANEGIDLLSDQIEEALLTTTAFSSNIQQFTAIDTQSVVTADGKQIVGEIGMIFECEIYQVWGPTGVPLVGVQATITNGPAGETLAATKITLSPPPEQTIREQILAGLRR